MKTIVTFATAFYATIMLSFGQDVKLHVNPRWSECSIQLDPSLTQKAWREFTREAGIVTYFRPLTDAKPMGAKRFELSILKWSTGIDDTKPKWNDTFVHPDSVHWLIDGPRLSFPGLTARVGITDKMDVGVYFTKAPGANYGFWGAQLQYNLINELEKKWSASARLSCTSLYGPEDTELSTFGIEAIASKEFSLYPKWLSVAPYVGVSTYLSNAHEKSTVVNLADTHVFGAQGMIGAVAKISIIRLSAEYNLSKLNTVSFKIGASL